jgi:hypothetical protein
MEAAISDESDRAASEDSTLFDVLQDSRMVRVVVERASGKSWKQSAAAAGVDESTIWLWRKAHPIDALIKLKSREAAERGMLRLMSKFGDAADLVCDFVDGKIEPEYTEKGASYSKAALRLAAAKETIGRMVKMAELEQQKTSGAIQVQGRGAELSNEQVLAAARAVQAKRLGKGR